jgi:hypothetical protein
MKRVEPFGLKTSIRVETEKPLNGKCGTLHNDRESHPAPSGIDAAYLDVPNRGLYRIESM